MPYSFNAKPLFLAWQRRCSIRLVSPVFPKSVNGHECQGVMKMSAKFKSKFS